MKRNLIKILMLTLLSATILAGCGNKESDKPYDYVYYTGESDDIPHYMKGDIEVDENGNPIPVENTDTETKTEETNDEEYVEEEEFDGPILPVIPEEFLSAFDETGVIDRTFCDYTGYETKEEFQYYYLDETENPTKGLDYELIGDIDTLHERNEISDKVDKFCEMFCTDSDNGFNSTRKEDISDITYTDIKEVFGEGRLTRYKVYQTYGEEVSPVDHYLIGITYGIEKGEFENPNGLLTFRFEDGKLTHAFLGYISN